MRSTSVARNRTRARWVAALAAAPLLISCAGTMRTAGSGLGVEPATPQVLVLGAPTPAPAPAAHTLYLALRRLDGAPAAGLEVILRDPWERVSPVLRSDDRGEVQAIVWTGPTGQAPALAVVSVRDGGEWRALRAAPSLYPADGRPGYRATAYLDYQEAP